VDFVVDKVALRYALTIFLRQLHAVVQQNNIVDTKLAKYNNKWIFCNKIQFLRNYANFFSHYCHQHPSHVSVMAEMAETCSIIR
jgi:hypothetical protein